jgi:hypothetical protein
MNKDKHDQLDRRTFLRIAGGTALAYAAPSLIAHAQQSASSGRKSPAKPVVLKSEMMEVVLDGEDGLPYEYRLVALKARFRGEGFGRPMTATVCRKTPWQFPAVPLKVDSVRNKASEVEFHFVVNVEQQPAVAFSVRYQLRGSTLTVSMSDVLEHTGYELIEVAMPSLVSVSENDGSAWLAHGDTGGNLAVLRDAKPGELKPNSFWGNLAGTLPVVMLGNGTAVCVQEVTSYMDGTQLEVRKIHGVRHASFGTTKTYRVNGGLCYDMNTGTGTPRNCGTANTPNLLVEQPSSCRLDFIGDMNRDESADWFDGAQFVQKRMPTIPKHIYDEKFVYGILCDQPLFEKPTATFEDCERIIRQVASLIDHAPQIVHLWGWQYRGKDSGYPAVQQVNSRIGGYDGLMRLMERAKSYNCIVTFSDNYDDAYRSSPAWNPDWIARRPDGQLWESRNWTGENSYIIGMAKYLDAALERVRYTCEHYKLPETTHVDVLSYFSIRNDWDPAHPASGYKNLQARYSILEEFAKHGVDVSSEALRYPMIGKISSFWYMTGPSPCPFGGSPIPLLPTIYRKSAVWGQSGRFTGMEDAILKMLFYNGFAHASFRGASDLPATTDLYYLMMVPWFKLHGRDIAAFRRDGDRTKITFEGNATAEMDWAEKTYSVTIDDIQVAGDLATFCPLDEDRIAFYSTKARELSTTMPRGWNASNIEAAELFSDRRNKAAVTVKNGRITVSVNAQQPVIVYRDSTKMRRSLQP